MAVLLSTAKRYLGRMCGATLALFCVFNSSALAFDAEASYVVTLRGVNIAQVDVDFKNDGKNYTVKIDGLVAGLASLVAAGTADLNSAGRVTANGLEADQFSLKTAANDEIFNVAFQAQNGNVTSYQITPPLTDNVNRVPVKNSHRKDVNDPVAAFLVKADELSPQICNRNMKIFTGIERYDIAMSFAENQNATSQRTGYQGPVVLCKMRYKPISGHFTSSATTTYMQNNQRFLVWFAPLKDTGYAIPYRVLVGTAFGDLSMVLTKLSAK